MVYLRTNREGLFFHTLGGGNTLAFVAPSVGARMLSDENFSSDVGTLRSAVTRAARLALMHRVSKLSLASSAGSTPHQSAMASSIRIWSPDPSNAVSGWKWWGWASLVGRGCLQAGAECPGVDQLDTAALIVAGIAGRHRGLASAGNRGDLAVKLADRPAIARPAWLALAAEVQRGRWCPG